MSFFIAIVFKGQSQNLENIKNELRKRGYHTPLIADIHFTPNAAEAAARFSLGV